MEAADLPLMFAAAADAISIIAQPERMMFLLIGVLVGLAIGILPGIGGLTGFALLIPFTYTMDPFAAFAMLLGMHSVTSTSDTIPAVLFGVPGTSSSQATVLDGLAMTKNGESTRALSAGYSASLIGGLFGALVLAVAIPVVRPFVLMIGTPELLALTVFGIAMVASLSGNAPIRGVIAACFGILIGMIGTDTQTGQLRWTGDILYLWDGVPLLPVLLGIFAFPELCDLSIKRRPLARNIKFSKFDGMFQGLKDCVNNWYLVLRCSALGTLLGAIPGITGSVIDWIAYGHALRSERNARQTFSTGDVRGVIAPESANNAKEGGSLVPTIAFGVPGSAGQAILLGALMIHGFNPGPDMLNSELHVTYSLVWSIAIANIVGAGLCFGLSGQFARISVLRYTLLLPAMMSIVLVGAFQGSRSWGDMFVLMFFGLLGWLMKQLRWPRPPIVLGLILGVLIERYMSISIMRYSADWLVRPGVLILLSLAVLALVRPFFIEIKHSGWKAILPRTRFNFHPGDLLYLWFLVIGSIMLFHSMDWPFGARIGPNVICSILITAVVVSYYGVAFSTRDKMGHTAATPHHGIHMDLDSTEPSNESRISDIYFRAAIFFAWFVAFLLLMWIIGLIPSVPVIVVAYMRFEGKEPWPLCFAFASGITGLIYVVFERIIHVPWPPTLVGEYLPFLSEFVPSM